VCVLQIKRKAEAELAAAKAKAEAEIAAAEAGDFSKCKTF